MHGSTVYTVKGFTGFVDFLNSKQSIKPLPLNQVILGSGTPSALQLSVIGSFFGTVMLSGCSVMWGARTSPAQVRMRD